MDGGISGDILERKGFRAIGHLSLRLRLSVWWHAEAKLQLVLLPLGSKSLVKGHKSYVMKSISEDGETYARDVNLLHDYLESHFPEVHVSFSFFRDVPPALAAEHLRRKARAETPTIEFPTVEDLALAQRELEAARNEADSLSALAEFIDRGDGGLIGGYVSRQVAASRRSVGTLEDRQAQERERHRRFQHLQREYERKGSAASFSFSVSSNIQLATTPEELRDAARNVVKELTDLHRYQVAQKLNGGRLNIQIEESDEPELSWLEEWMGGALSSTQLERLEPDFKVLREAARSRLMVTADEDVVLDGHAKEDCKLLGARVFSSLVGRLDRTGNSRLADREVPASAMPLRIGRLMNGDSVTSDDFLLPLHGANHIYASGTTGSGKSYLGRIIIEEATKHRKLGVLVLDPRNQSAGLLVPEDREAVLGLYPEFGMKPDQTRAFRFKYFSPGQGIGGDLPELGDLGIGRHIVSFKGLDDEARCSLFADLLDAVFDRHAASESETTRLLIVIEEAHRFTKKRVDESARSAATRAENALDRTVREGRKFGCCVLILSQTIRDFAYDSASIRQNTNTKIFMHNSDREIEYAANFIGDGKQVIKLPPATAIVHHPIAGIAKVRVRPPLSKVWEFSAEDTRRIVHDPAAVKRTVSNEARELLRTIETLCAAGGGVNVTELCEHLGVTSKRRIQSLLSELERVNLVRSRRLRARGSPRVIEPIASAPRTEPRTRDGLDADETDATGSLEEGAS